MRRVIVGALLVALGCARPDTAPRAPDHADVTDSSHVRWSPWQRATFSKARAEHKLILVNVVATWCHWCHVMEETTYTDPEVAELLARHFVTIRVDSDARPDVAERYREWGWPATGFLSPDAHPVLELRGYHDPRTFAKVLRSLVADRDAGTLARRRAPAPARSATELVEVRDRVIAQLDGFYEPVLGGWGRRQRYPLALQIEHAFARARTRADTKWRERALQTLDASRNLVDPVWGGMYQYSLGDWQHPHYEKITAIQAGAIASYAIAARATGDPRWLAPARAVASYMRTFMRDEHGGFATSQDADLRSEGGNVVLGKAYYAKSSAERHALGLPRIDPAVYADLNGSMIDALCELYAATLDAELLALAVSAAEHVIAEHETDAGSFTHGADDDPDGVLYLRDQAAMGRALLALHRVTGDHAWLDRASRVGAELIARFTDPQTGGFFAHTPDREAVGGLALRRMPLEENGLAARFLLGLHRRLDGDGTAPPPYADAAKRALAALGAPTTFAPEGRMVGAYLMALEDATMPTIDVTVVGDLRDGRTRTLFDAALQWYEPRAVLETSAPGARYPDLGAPAVYLCTETACSTPITSAASFAATADAFVRG